MENEIEKLIKEREDEIRRNNEASLNQQEASISTFATYLFAIIGFLKGCGDYIHAVDQPGYIGDKMSFMDFLNPFIYPALGALFAWILVKVIFALIRFSK